MIYERRSVRVDYSCLKTNRIQVLTLVHYHIFGSDGSLTEIIPAKKWQQWKRKEKNRRKNETKK